MSSPPRRDDSSPSRRPVTLMKLAEKRALGEPIVMVTAYDHPSALAVEAAGVDIVLVGDSAANNVLGYPDTVPVTVEELLMLSAAVHRGLTTPLLVGDLPFGSYEASDTQAITTAQRFVKEAGCDAVKLEGGGASAERARAIVRAGVPVMGHVGLTPQTATALGGYRDTVPITLDEILMLARAVRRGLRTPLMVGDLPFGTYEASDEQAIATAHRFVKEAGCDAVKLEGGGQMAQRARAIVEAGTPVMGHVGLTPQTATCLLYTSPSPRDRS